MKTLKYKTFPKRILMNSGINKGELAKWMGIENLAFDPSVPQGWLDYFVKKHGLDYHQFLSTIMYVYPTGLPSGIISGCTEFDNLLGNYSGRYDGKWKREDHEEAPEGTVQRELDALHYKVKSAIKAYHEKTGRLVERMDFNWIDDKTIEIESY